MGLRVLIVPDKFKGTLTAQQVAEAVASGWQSARPSDLIETLPMTDGGDGFGQVVGELLGGRVITTKTVDAAHRPVVANWWWHEQSRTAVIEAARINGLAQLPPGKYHPFELDTFGIGEVLKEAADRTAKRVIMGIGGSATNDGGFGVARAMGWEFFNNKSALIDRWTDLHTLSQIKPPARERWFDELLVAVDVQNPLLGEHGCTRIYGPQKGLKPSDFEFTERCLSSLSRVAHRELHVNSAVEPGAGAAGGLGFALRTFVQAKLVPGFHLFADLAGLHSRLAGADLVITGEGALDQQSLMGKGVGELAGMSKGLGKPCVAIAGTLGPGVTTNGLFKELVPLTSMTTDEEARANAAHWVEQAARRVAEAWNVESVAR